MSLTTPRWLSQALIYEVFVRNHGPQGGFAAVTADLPRIRSLGTDIVWLMPIHPIGQRNRTGTLGSPYAVRDYRAVNPELGTREALDLLIAECHRLGMKLMMDVVFNHTSPDSLLAQEHRDWFAADADGNLMPRFPEWKDIADLAFFSHSGEPNQDLWDYLAETLALWADAGVDGFRCDVASLVPPAFWKQARDAVAAAVGPREILWLAETSHKAFLKFMRDSGYRAWSDGEMLGVFDLSYDHDGVEYLDGYFAGKRGLGDYLNHLLVQETMNPMGSLKLRFTENHDQPRSADKIRSTDRLKNWTAFHALLPGAFLIYAGQEYMAVRRPGLFDADPIAIPVGVPTSGGSDSGPYAIYVRDLVTLMKRIKNDCLYFHIRELRAGFVQITWSDCAAAHGKELDGPLVDGETRYTVFLNLEDRFGSFDPGRKIQGECLIGQNVGQSIDIAGETVIPRLPLAVRERATGKSDLLDASVLSTRHGTGDNHYANIR